jgi:transposase, IS5 family
MTQTVDFFRSRLDAMIDLRHPLAVLATRLPWSELEAELAPIWRKRSTRPRSLVKFDGVLRGYAAATANRFRGSSTLVIFPTSHATTQPDPGR